MFFMEQTFDSEKEILDYFQEASSEDKQEFREYIIDPVVNVLSTPSGKKKYIQYGSDFIDVNSDMLAKPYPTTQVSYPRKYVDEMFALFGYDKNEYRTRLKQMLKKVHESASFNTMLNSMTNIFHTIAMFYSDMIYDSKLRDSARQQIGLTSYGHALRKYFPHGVEENLMEYTYSKLNLTWELKKAESVVKWIDHTVEVAYGNYRTKLSLDMNIQVLVGFIGRMWTSFNQSMQYLRDRFSNDMDEANIRADVHGDETYLDDSGYAKYRDALVRMIRQGDSIYKEESQLYKATARNKNVKCNELYTFAQKVDTNDIKRIIDLVFYVFLVKEQHKLDDINSAAYINRINQFPTAIDRAIPTHPVIKPMCDKYKEKEMIVKTYICLLATYMMLRLNEVR
jgi:hypothetical protein